MQTHSRIDGNYLAILTLGMFFVNHFGDTDNIFVYKKRYNISDNSINEANSACTNIDYIYIYIYTAKNLPNLHLARIIIIFAP